jgi:hypothetical protein
LQERKENYQKKKLKNRKKEMAARDRDLERLIPIQNPDININNIITNGGSNSSSESVSPIISSHHSSSEEVLTFSYSLLLLFFVSYLN